MRVGIVGLGKMGRVFVDRLLDAGHDVLVWNRSAGPAEEARAKGAKVAASLGDLAEGSEIVLSIVTDEKVFPDIFEGPNGMLAGRPEGKLFVEMSTVAPPAHIALDEIVRAAGGHFLECPVSGSVTVAREGRCLGFAGGAAADVERARPVLEVLCRQIEHAGEVGAGAALKLAINLPLAVFWQALGEALAICEPYGFDPKRLVELFTESTGGANALKNRGPSVATALSGGEVPVTADIATFLKDMGLMIATAKAQGHESPVIERARDAFADADKRGLGKIDCSAYPAYWAKKGKSETIRGG